MNNNSQISKINKIKNILYNYSLSKGTVLATRAMLRSVPFIEDINSLHPPFSYWLQREENLFNIFNAMRVSVAFSSLDKLNLVDGDIVINSSAYDRAYTSSDEATDYMDCSDGNNIDVAYSAAHAVYAAVVSYFNDIKYSHIMDAIIKTTGIAMIYYDPNDILINAFLSDAKKIKNEKACLFIKTPLWSKPPDIWLYQLDYFYQIIIELHPSFNVWKEWYEKCINGTPITPYLCRNEIFIAKEIDLCTFQEINIYFGKLWNISSRVQYSAVYSEIICRTDNPDKELHKRCCHDIFSSLITSQLEELIFNSKFFTKFFIDKDNLYMINDNSWAYYLLKKYDLKYIIEKVPFDEDGETDKTNTIFKFWAKNYPEIFSYSYQEKR